MRPLVDDVQSLPPGIDELAYPRTPLGLELHDLVVEATTRPPSSRLAAKITQVAGTDQELPALHETVA